MTNQQKPQPPQKSPQDVFNGALMNALASQRDGYANAAAEAAAKLVIAQGALQETQAAMTALSDELAQAKAEVKALIQKLESAQPAASESAASESEGSTQD